jgi:hypothetical protein
MSSLSGLAGAPPLQKKAPTTRPATTFDDDFESMLEAPAVSVKQPSKKHPAKHTVRSIACNWFAGLFHAPHFVLQADSRKAVSFAGNEDSDEEYSPYPSLSTRPAAPGRFSNTKGVGAASTANNMQAAYRMLDSNEDDAVYVSQLHGKTQQEKQADAPAYNRTGASTGSSKHQTKEQQDEEFQRILASASASESPASGHRPQPRRNEAVRSASNVIDDVLGLTEEAMTGGGRQRDRRSMEPAATTSLRPSLQSAPIVVMAPPVRVSSPFETRDEDDGRDNDDADWDASATDLPLYETAKSAADKQTAAHSDGSGHRGNRSGMSVSLHEGEEVSMAEESTGMLSDSAFDAAFAAGFGEDEVGPMKTMKPQQAPVQPQPTQPASQPSLSILGSTGSSLSLLAGGSAFPKPQETTSAPQPALAENMDSLLSTNSRRRRVASAGVPALELKQQPDENAPRSLSPATRRRAVQPMSETFPTDNSAVSASHSRPVSVERKRMATDLGFDSSFGSPGASVLSPPLPSHPPSTHNVSNAMSAQDFAAAAVSPRTPGSAISSHRSPRGLVTSGSFYRNRPGSQPNAVPPLAELSPRTLSSNSNVVNLNRRSARSPNDDALSNFHPAVAEMPFRSSETSEGGYLDRKVTSLEGEIETLTTLLHRTTREREAEMEAANARWQAKLLAMQATHESEVQTLRSRLEARLQDTLVSSETSAATTMRVAQNRIRALELELADMKASNERTSLDTRVRHRDEIDAAVLERVTSAVHDAKAANAAEKAVLERRHADECAFLRRVHAEELEAWRARLQEASEVNMLAAQVRSVTKSVEDVQTKLSSEAGTAVASRMAALDAREKLLLDMEARMRSVTVHAEDESRRLQSLLASIEASMAGQRKQLEDDRARLDSESSRLSAWQAVIMKEVEATRTGALTERQQLQTVRLEVEQERRTVMADVAKMYREAQAAKDEGLRAKADALVEIDRLQGESRQELASLRAAIEATRLDLTALSVNRDTVAAEVRKLQNELALASGEKAAIESLRAQRDAEIAQATEQVATARRLQEEAQQDRVRAEQARQDAEQARHHAAQLEAAAAGERERAEATIHEISEERRSLVEERAGISRERQQLIQTRGRPSSTTGPMSTVLALPSTAYVSSVGAASKLGSFNGTSDYTYTTYGQGNNSNTMGGVPTGGNTVDARVAPLQPRNASALNTAAWTGNGTLTSTTASGGIGTGKQGVDAPVDRSSMRQMLADWQQDSAKATQALLADHEKLMFNIQARRGPTAAAPPPLPSPPSSSPLSYEDPGMSLIPRSTSGEYGRSGNVSASNASALGTSMRGEEGFSALEGTLASLGRLSDAHSTA